MPKVLDVRVGVNEVEGVVAVVKVVEVATTTLVQHDWQTAGPDKGGW